MLPEREVGMLAKAAPLSIVELFAADMSDDLDEPNAQPVEVRVVAQGSRALASRSEGLVLPMAAIHGSVWLRLAEGLPGGLGVGMR